MFKKKYYYVLVTANDGAKFVTEYHAEGLPDGSGHVRFNGDVKPLALKKRIAKKVLSELNKGMNVSYLVVSEEPINFQPYVYHLGHFEWHWHTKGV